MHCPKNDVNYMKFKAPPTPPHTIQTRTRNMSEPKKKEEKH